MVAAVVFDLDGTLVDTAPDLVATLNTIFAREGLPPVAYEAARNMVGGGARLMIERGLAAERRILPAGRDRPALPGLHRSLCRPYRRPLAAVPRARGRARRARRPHGCRLIVCTNKLEWLSVRLLDALGLSSRFVAICGADTFGLKKPDPELLRRTHRAGRRPADRAVMVGDSANDIDMARAAGIPVVAVDFGYTEIPAQRIECRPGDQRFRDLPKAVFGLLRRTRWRARAPNQR